MNSNTLETSHSDFNPDAILHAKRVSNWAFGGVTLVLALSGAQPAAILTGASWYLFNRALSVKAGFKRKSGKPRNPIKSASVMTGVAAFLIVGMVLKMGPIIGLLAAWGAAFGMRKLLSSETFQREGSAASVPPAPPLTADRVSQTLASATASNETVSPIEPAIISAARADIDRLLNAAARLNDPETTARLLAIADSLNLTLSAIAQDDDKTASARTLLSVHLPAAADLTEDFANAPVSSRSAELADRFKQLVGSLSERSDALHERFVGREARKLDVKMEVLKKRLEEDY